MKGDISIVSYSFYKDSEDIKYKEENRNDAVLKFFDVKVKYRKILSLLGLFIPNDQEDDKLMIVAPTGTLKDLNITQ